MAQILFDVTRLLERSLKGRLPTGVDRIGLQYLRRYGDHARALVRFGGRWVATGSSDSRRIFEALLASDRHLGPIVRWCVGKAYVLGSRGPLANAILVNAVHSGLEDPSYAQRAAGLALKPVFFLHDLIPLTFPEYCRPGEAARHRRRLETMLEAGRGVVVNSKATLREFEAHAAALGRKLPRCVVAPIGPAVLPRPDAARPLDAPYFVMLGTIEPRKNHWMTLHVWRQLAAEVGSSAPRLVLVGQRGWECEQVVDMLERSEPLRDLVLEKPSCSDRELATWLHHAQALIFPSFAEGFGIPLLEAFLMGAPVIASELGVFREIASDLPEYLDPLDGLGWKRAILDYARPDSARRDAQRARIRDFPLPTWEQHFAKVDALLDSVAAGP